MVKLERKEILEDDKEFKLALKMKQICLFIIKCDINWLKRQHFAYSCQSSTSLKISEKEKKKTIFMAPK